MLSRDARLDFFNLGYYFPGSSGTIASPFFLDAGVWSARYPRLFSLRLLIFYDKQLPPLVAIKRVEERVSTHLFSPLTRLPLLRLPEKMGKFGTPFNTPETPPSSSLVGRLVKTVFLLFFPHDDSL